MHKVLSLLLSRQITRCLVIGYILMASGQIFGFSQKKTVVSVNCDKAEAFNLDSPNMISFDIGITEPVSDVLFHENKIILRFKNSITAYDLEKGDSLFSYSRKGRKDDEFTSLSNAWLVGDVLELYDYSALKILRFDVSKGDFLNCLNWNDLDRKHMFSSLRWDESSRRFIGNRVFSVSPLPELAEYDVSHHFVKEVASPLKRSGFILSSSPIVVSESGRLLYHQPFHNSVSRIEGRKTIQEYSIDFGKYNLPKSISEEEGGKAMRLWIESKEKYAVAMEFWETRKAFYINYVLSNKSYMVKYDRIKGSSNVYYFTPRGGKIAFNQGIMYIITQNEKGTTIYKIPEANLR